MLTNPLVCTEVRSTKEVLSSPTDSPGRGDGSDVTGGLSATASESSSQPSSWHSRDDSPEPADTSRRRSSGLSSFMPIVDEADVPADGSTAGQTTSEDEQPPSPFSEADAARKAAYARQVQLWQQVEAFYLKHEGWAEHRVILLIQEAFRSSLRNLKRARADGTLSDDSFADRVAELRGSLVAIKGEYRRTLQRTRERRGDLAGIASKAVTCIASVYPWSSGGFVMGFEENLRYAELAGVVGGSARRGPPPSSPTFVSSPSVATVPAVDVALVPMPQLESETAERDADEGDDLSLSDSVVARRRCRRVPTPSVASRPLPPLPDRDPVTVSATLAAAPIVLDGPSNESPVRGGPFSPSTAAPRSPVPLPNPAVAGPLRGGEGRYLEKRQIVVSATAFVSRSLASTSFIASRRATIAAATMRQRLAGAAAEACVAPTLPPSTVSPVRRVVVLEEPPAPTPDPTPVPTPAPTPAATPVLPTRFLMDPAVSYEGAAFDSHPNSFTRRSNPTSMTKRPTAGGASAAAHPEPPAAATRSQPSSVTKRAAVVASPAPYTAPPPPPPAADPSHRAAQEAMRGLPYSYTGRTVSGPVMVPGQPHSYTTRSAAPCMSAGVYTGIMVPVMGAVYAPPYGTPPAAATVGPLYGMDYACPAGLTAFATPVAMSSLNGVVFAVPAPPPPPPPPPVVLAAAPPPGYSTHVRRDRLRSTPSTSSAPYSGMPCPSAEDEQHMKELW